MPHRVLRLEQVNFKAGLHDLKNGLFFFSFVGDQTRTSSDDVVMSQLQAISQLSSLRRDLASYQISCLDKKWPPTGKNVYLAKLGPKSFGNGRQVICEDRDWDQLLATNAEIIQSKVVF